MLRKAKHWCGLAALVINNNLHLWCIPTDTLSLLLSLSFGEAVLLSRTNICLYFVFDGDDVPACLDASQLLVWVPAKLV